MTWETWPERRRTIQVKRYDSAQPWEGPGRILVDPDTEEKVLVQDGDRDIPNLQDGDILYRNRHGNVFRADDTRLARLMDEWEPPKESAVLPAPAKTTEPGVT